MTQPVSSARPLSGAYRAVWRWHFYAGLLVLPIIMLMALTGALYLFHNEIDGLIYGQLSHVEVGAAPPKPDQWIPAAEARTGGQVVNLVMPARPDEAVRLTVATSDRGKRTVFIDPYSGAVTGEIAYGGVMETVKQLHSLSLLGSWANYLVEIVAGWAIILAATGVFLWWPRGRAVGVATIRASRSRGRPFWRDLHAVTGLYAGCTIAFLALTGMPWSAFWGDQYMAWVKDRDLGRPAAPAAATPLAHAAHAQGPTGVGWTLADRVMPGAAAPGRLSSVIVAADARALQRPYTISVPTDPRLGWTAAPIVRRVEDTRVLYVDASTGRVLGDVGYAQFGIGARAFEWGIAVHQGLQYGWINRYLMLAACIAIWILAISGVLMWWTRRPPRLAPPRIGVPDAPDGLRVRAAVLGIVLPLGLLFPLTGLSLAAALGVDVAVRRVARIGRSA